MQELQSASSEEGGSSDSAAAEPASLLTMPQQITPLTVKNTVTSAKAQCAARCEGQVRLLQQLSSTGDRVAALLQSVGEMLWLHNSMAVSDDPATRDAVAAASAAFTAAKEAVLCIGAVPKERVPTREALDAALEVLDVCSSADEITALADDREEVGGMLAALLEAASEDARWHTLHQKALVAVLARQQQLVHVLRACLERLQALPVRCSAAVARRAPLPCQGCAASSAIDVHRFARALCFPTSKAWRQVSTAASSINTKLGAQKVVLHASQGVEGGRDQAEASSEQRGVSAVKPSDEPAGPMPATTQSAEHLVIAHMPFRKQGCCLFWQHISEDAQACLAAAPCRS